MWWSLSHVQRLWSNQVSTNLSVYCWPKVCHSLKPILFSAAFGVWSSWRSAFLRPGNVSSVLFTNQFILMSPPVDSCWKISFVAEEEINRDMENISLNGWGRIKRNFSPSISSWKSWVNFEEVRAGRMSGVLMESEESVFFNTLLSFGRAPFSPKIASCSATHWHQQPSKSFKMPTKVHCQQLTLGIFVEPAQVSSAGSKILG